MLDFKLGYHTICWGGVTGEPVGVTSVKDLFYRSYGDTERAIAEIAEAGYDGFEVFDGNLLDLADDRDRFRRQLERTGLQLLGVYSGANFIYDEILDEELWRIRKAAELAGDVGARHLVVGGGAQRSTGIHADDHKKLAAALETVCDIAEASGLDPVFHPHLTTIVESPDQVETVLSLSRIGLCADTAHLAAGGGDPAAMIRQHADRLRYVHLKDFRAEPFGFHPLGEGDLDLGDVIQALRDIGYDRWATVELDDYSGEPIEAARISLGFLEQFT
jgi:inosose dehydratase